MELAYAFEGTHVITGVEMVADGPSDDIWLPSDFTHNHHIFRELRPIWIDDVQRQKRIQELFASSLTSRPEAENDGGSILRYKSDDGERSWIISKPREAGQRISAFGISSYKDWTVVAYVVSQGGAIEGWFGHSLRVTRLDPWLLDQSDVDEILQQPIIEVNFEGPEITDLRFGTREFEGVLLLESEPSAIFLEMMWSPQRLRELACAAYRPLEDGKPPNLSPRFRETVERWMLSESGMRVFGSDQKIGARLCSAG